MQKLPSAVALVAAAALAGAIAAPASAAVRHPRPHKQSPLVAVAGPIRQEVRAIPGHSVPVRFVIGDPSLTVPLRVTMTQAAFTETAGGAMIPAPVPASEVGWLRFARQSMTLRPGNVAVYIAARLTVPRGTLAGDYPIAGAFSVRRTDESLTTTGAHTVPVVYAEVIASVPGQAGHGVTYSLAGGSGLHVGGPVWLTASVRNDGHRVALLNHLQVTGDGTVRLPGTVLLPGATRSYRVELASGTCAPCHVAFGGSARRSVWLLPAVLVAVVLAVIIASPILSLWQLRRRRRRRPAAAVIPEPTDPATEVLNQWRR